MFCAAMSNSTSLSEDAASVSSAGTTKVVHDLASLNPHPVSSFSPHPQQQQQIKVKKKRSLPGNPDPDAEVIALSPKTLMATNRFVCEICNKGFQRDQNLQLHRRGHNLPWKLKQRSTKEMKKKAYVCPEPSCVHHHPSRALGDLTGIKKHFCRKHGEKKWKCDKCSKIYAVQSDWKAHSKTCGTREYRCDCGTLFSRKDSFITHRAFCDALAEESARLSATQFANTNPPHLLLTHNQPSLFPNFTPPHDHHHQISLTCWDPHPLNPNPNPTTTTTAQDPVQIKPEPHHITPPPFFLEPPSSAKGLMTLPYPNLHVSTQPTSNVATSSAHLSATALLQKAAAVGSAATAITAGCSISAQQPQSVVELTPAGLPEFLGLSTWQKTDRLTRDFLGLTGDRHGNGCTGSGGGNGNLHRYHEHGSGVNVSMNTRDMLTFTGGAEFDSYERDQSILLNLNPHGNGFGFAEHAASETWGDC